ncbi:helix-turn-helix domain-containing protein [Treponema denticola]|uniref:S24 family peptidase n=1 Tax=Treponema denticola TaxID=158 RepID=UPI003D8EDDCF
MDIYKRFTYLREQRGLNKSAYAKFLSITPSEISDIENGEIEPSKRIISRLVEKQNINAGWLLTGLGEPFLKEEIEPPKPAILQELENTALEATAQKFAEHENRFTEIEAELRELRSLYEQKFKNEPPQPDSVSEPAPLYTAAYEEPEETVDLPLAQNLAAGIPVEASDVNDTFPVPKKLIPNKRKKYCVAKIKGSSMTEAGIENGSCILLEYTDQPIDGEIMVVSYNSNTTLKLLHQNIKGEWELLYRDGSGAKIELKDGDWEVKGRFVAVLPKKRQ